MIWKNTLKHQMKCLMFVWLGLLVPLENSSLILRSNHFRLRAANVDIYLELMTMKQWGFFSFFSVPHLLWTAVLWPEYYQDGVKHYIINQSINHLFWRGTSVSNGQFRGPVRAIRTFFFKTCSNGIVTSYFNNFDQSQLWIEQTTFRIIDKKYLTAFGTDTVQRNWNK